MKRGENEFDLDSPLASVDKIREMKAKKEAKPSTSVRPLKFEENPGDSILKKMIIKEINAQDLTYADLLRYCTQIMDGDVKRGSDFGYNTITGLRKRPTMTDVTFYILADFLNMDVALVKREKPKEEGDLFDGEII